MYYIRKINFWKFNVFLTIVILFVFSFKTIAQTVTITSPVASATYCAGTNVTVNYTITSAFGAGNVFTTQLSDALGSFTSPTTIGTRTATTSGGSACLIPFTTLSGSLYRIRVLASNPTFTSQSNGVDLTINALALSTPTVPNSIYCQNEIFNVSFSQSCNFSNVGFNNVYSVQLSDASGSFASPITIGTRTAVTAAAITCTIPSSAGGSGYRIRIVSSNPAITSADNGSDIAINASSGNPSVFSSGTWNAYCFNGANNFTTNYQGYFTEDNLSFDTRTRFGNTLSPSSATVGVSSTGLAYAGCPFGSGTNYSVSYKRTNIPCGLYRIDIPAHDDNTYFYMNGTLVWSHLGCCDAHPNIYTGFISPSDNLEFRYYNGGGPGYLAVNMYTINPLSMSAPVTICAGTNATISATNSNTIPVNYSWEPSAFASPSVGTMSTVINPTITTVFTLTATDAGTTTCSYSNTLNITVNPVPTTTAASTNSYVCSGANSSTLTAGGAASYTWSPASGLNTTIGNLVIANPSVATVYTVSGSNNCAIVTATVSITANTQPATPSPTAYGSGVWNVYCYSTPNTYTFTTNQSAYYGYYTENNLAFDSRNRWGTGVSPSSANGGTIGLAYQGCIIPNDYHSTIAKRSNFPCGYYQMDIPYHDDHVMVYVNGALVYQNAGCCAYRTNIWTGFLGASSTVDVWVKEAGGGSATAFTLVPVSYPVLNAPITLCAGTSGSLTASPFIAGANYLWSSPNPPDLSTTSGTVTIVTPTASGIYTCTVTDPVTTCSASSTTTVNVNPLPTTTVSPTNSTISCSIQQYTLSAGGAYTYSWAPSAGLSATTGNSVVANPTVTTIYTVTGNNNCTGVDATSTITVVPLVSPTVFPSSAWNVYCHNNTTFNSYYGYYTHFGSGTTGYDFNTTTQWVNGSAPSTATANASGTAYQGCTMNATNISLSFKRSNFTCGTYTVVLNNHDDGVALLIDGIQVATRATSSASVNLWVGILNVNSQVEFRLNQGAGGSGLRVSFIAATPTASLSTWIGATSSDWFTVSNWCGSGIPSLTTDVLIPNSKPQFMPVINASGAACRSLTISAASPSTTLLSAMPSASLSISGTNGLDVYGNWINNGSFDAGNGTVNIFGTTSTSITGTTATETFYNLVINKTGVVTVTIPSGIKQIANSMTFTNGIVNQNGTLRFLNGASTSGASNSSFINGQVIKVGTQVFTFPIGAGAFYRPIGITAPAVATDNFTAQYFLADASPSYTHTSKDASIHHIGRCEYWILNRTVGSSNVSVTLSWNTTSCGVTNLSDLLVARWDAGQARWKDEGNGGTTGNTSSGTIITSAPVTLFSPFTLASTTSANPLPIELVSFSCSNNKNINSLSWVTASEVNNDYFSIERSFDGIHFEQVAKQKGAGNSVTSINYTYKDQSLYNGISYYRLKQVDFNGKSIYSEICSVNNSNADNLIFYPNPVKNTLTVEYEFVEKPSTTMISVTDITGKVIDVNVSYINSKITLDCSKLEEGIYFLKVIIAEKEVVSKFTVQK